MLQVGIPKATLDLIDGMVDTCRICRFWTQPIIPSSRIVTGFNVEADGDWVFYDKMRTLLHMIDQGTRWAAAHLLQEKTTRQILQGLDQWLSPFRTASGPVLCWRRRWSPRTSILRMHTRTRKQTPKHCLTLLWDTLVRHLWDTFVWHSRITLF